MSRRWIMALEASSGISAPPSAATAATAAHAAPATARAERGAAARFALSAGSAGAHDGLAFLEAVEDFGADAVADAGLDLARLDVVLTILLGDDIDDGSAHAEFDRFGG